MQDQRIPIELQASPSLWDRVRHEAQMLYGYAYFCLIWVPTRRTTRFKEGGFIWFFTCLIAFAASA